MDSDHINLKGMKVDRIAELLSLGTSGTYPWSEEDLAAILEYQLNRPLQGDLGGLPKTLVQELTRLEKKNGGGVHTFGYWLHHAHPPVELLRLIKRYAKSCHANPQCGIPPKVSLVLYYLSLAVALVRCRTSITSLKAEELKAGFDQLANAKWVDEASRAIFEQAWLCLSKRVEDGQEPRV